MKFKTMSLILIILLCLVFITACKAKTDEEAYLYKSSNVEVSLNDNAGETEYVGYEWAALTDNVAYKKNTAAITGTVSNIRQVTVSYKYMGTDVSDNITIFDVEVSDVVYCRSDFVKQGDTVTVGVGYNMNSYGEGLPEIKDGTTYMMFCYPASETDNDALELAGYVDLWISAPKDLFLEKVGDYYLTSDYFSNVPNAISLADTLDMNETQITALSTFAVENISAAKNYIDKDILSGAESDIPEAPEALLVLKTRTAENSTRLWDVANRSYLIKAIDLEEYVRDKAMMYDK
jgi:hypothetical protein